MASFGLKNEVNLFINPYKKVFLRIVLGDGSFSDTPCRPWLSFALPHQPGAFEREDLKNDLSTSRCK